MPDAEAILFVGRREILLGFGEGYESEGGEDEGVGAVDGGSVEAGEVDLGCCLAVVSHAF